ncbi:MAG: rhodanese-like domain-containing protein [Gammaproteobacteria bacterium]|nr:rhodanese-like domain-containing protein [Gammaproteobacteria bacterium]
MSQYLEFFQRHTLMVLAFIGLTAGIIWTFVAGRSPGVGRVSPMDLTRLVNQKDAAVVDVRADAEFRQGHIVGALNVPPGQMESQKGKLEKLKGKPVVVVCKTGQVAPKVAGELRKQGFEDVHTLQGGLVSWESASLPLVKS